MRVKGGNKHERRNKILKQAKGYFGSKHRLYRTAKEQLLHSWDYSYQHRRTKKREFRALWITRISAAVNQVGLSYSKFMHGLKVANVNINRKMLSELAINDPTAFTKLVDLAKEKLTVK
jgi:large subunit ribosomal protein L20